MPIVSPWTVYNTTRRRLMDGGFDLDNDTFQMTLHGAGSNANDKALTLAGQLTGEVTNGNGYATGGKSLTGVTWDVGPSAEKMRLNCAPVIWNASGGDIAGILFAVIWRVDAGDASKRFLLAFCQLNDIPFALTNGNALAVDPGSGGIFDLS